MTQHLTIITGASRGMGLAMAEQRLAQGHDLLCISRRQNEALGARTTVTGQRCDQWQVDLADPQPAAARLEAWLAALSPATYESVTLINNAALLPRAMPTGALDAAEIAQAMRVNLEAPMLLTSAFLRATQAWSAQRKVLNISSGLGRRAMASQGPYCAAKAGLDHFTRCVALEEAARPNGAKVSSLAPGVIDTDMQIHLRTADASQFPDVGNFIGMKANGALSSPAEAAAKVLGVLARPDFGSNPITDVRD
ncbi:MAG: SDR family NAD(P)-dependent oxidoreductase [Pseudomonadota bacterium]